MRKTKLAKLIMGVIFTLVLSSISFATSVDIIPPKGEVNISNATLKNGVYYVGGSEITLNITASDNVSAEGNLKMLITKNPVSAEILESSSWENYSASKDFDLGSDVKCTVCVYLKDEAGNISSNQITASKTYTIAYVADGAANVPNPQTVEYGKAFSIASIEPKMSNKVFLGWSKEEGGTNVEWSSSEIVEPKNITGDMTLYAVWQDETRNLSETVKVGDFVDYPVDYSNANSSNLKGWRVLSIEDGVVKLISTGTPLTYTKGSSTYDDLVTNFINKTSSDFVTYGFTDTIKNTFNNLYITKVESVKESDILNITGNASISGIDVSNYGGVLNNNTAYLIPGESNIYYKNASNGNIAASEEITYGVRVVVTLSEHTQTSGKNIKGEWEINVPTYIVLYNANGGNVSITNSTTYKVEVVNGGKYYGTDFALPEATKEGCTFIGWFTEEGEKITESSIVDLEENTTLYARWNEIPKVAQAVYTEGNKTLTFVKRAPIAVGDTLNGHAVTAVYTGIEEDTYTNAADVPWKHYASVITTAVVEDTISPVSTRRWFNTMTNLTIADLKNLDTSKVTTMYAMFQVCINLESLDLSGFDVSNVTDMTAMFNSVSNYGDMKLSTIGDVSKWNTSKVTTMDRMFHHCSNLRSLDVSNWDTSSVENMEFMFSYCSTLTTLDVSKWNTSNVTTMRTMFQNCSNLTTLDVSRKTVTKEDGTIYTAWNTENVTDMSYMFNGCTGLTALYVSGCDTQNVTTMYQMFTDCSKIAALDLTNFSSLKLTDATGMFYGMNNLQEIKIGANFTFKGTTVETGSLPTPSNSYITGADGKWYNIATQQSYTAAEVAALPSGEARTFSAIAPIAQALYLAEDTSLRFVKTQPLTTSDTYDGKAITAVYTGIEEDTYEAQTDVPWNQYASVITTVVVEDVISPVSTRRWFNTMSNLTSVDVENLDTSKTITMAAMFRKCTKLETINVSNFVTDNVSDMASMFYGASLLKELKVDNWNTANVTDMSFMFAGVTGTQMSLATLDVSRFDTSQATTMCKMFYNCTSLKTIDVSKWDTSNVTDMSFMFAGYDDQMGLESLDVSKWNTSKVTTMSTMFQNCSNLTTLDVSKKIVTKEDGTTYTAWDTGLVEDMSYMFNRCSGLTTLDVSGWNTSKVTNMGNMFYYCRNLTALDVSNWNTSNVTDMSYMFTYCNKIEKLDLSSFNTNKVTSMNYMFNMMHKLQEIKIGANFKFLSTATTPETGSLPTPSNSYITGADGKWYNIATQQGYTAAEVAALPSGEARTFSAIAPIAQALYLAEDTSLRFVKTQPLTTEDTYDGKAITAVYTGIEEDTYEAQTDVPWYEFAGTITTAIVEDTISPVSTQRWFDRVTNLESVSLTKLDTSKVTTMRTMFQLCSKLTTIDMTGWNTENVTDMAHLFSKCSSLNKLDVSEWNTSKVENMQQTFGECSSLKTIDVSKWDTQNVTNMYGLFGGTSEMALETLDVSNWDTSKVTTMRVMFQNCSKLTTLDVSKKTVTKEDGTTYTAWNTENVTDMAYMFNSCSGLTTLVVSGWNTSKVTIMNTMFQNCSNLSTLDLSNWNTANVTNMAYMFNKCRALTSLDLSSFNTSKVTDMTYMFGNDYNLKEITIGANFKFLSTATTPATGSLPTPSNSYITGADGNWYNKVTGSEHTAAEVAALPSGEARTFVAIDPKVAITFEANGGNVTGYNSTSVTLSGMPGLAYSQIDYGNGLPEAYWDGYTFLGWYTAATNGTKVTADSTIGNSNHTLYAQWEESRPIVGDYVNYPATYTNPSTYNGWRIMEVGEENVTLVSAGIPLESDLDNFKTIIDTNSLDAEFTKNYFDSSKTVKEIFQNKFTYIDESGNLAVRGFTLDDLNKVCNVGTENETTVLENDLARVDDLSEAGYMKDYVLATKDRVGVTYNVRPSGGIHSEPRVTYPFRVVVTLNPEVVFTGKDENGYWNIEIEGEESETEEYTVTFNANGGQLTDYGEAQKEFKVMPGGTYAEVGNGLGLPNANRDGYTFLGWFTEVSGGTQIANETTVDLTGDITLYARWDANSYTVTLDHNDGLGTTSTITVTHGGTYVNLPSPTRDGYTFLGWFTAAEGGTEITADMTLVENGSHTLYAQWEENVNTSKVIIMDEMSEIEFEYEEGMTWGDLIESKYNPNAAGNTLSIINSNNITVSKVAGAPIAYGYINVTTDLPVNYAYKYYYDMMEEVIVYYESDVITE